MLKPKPDETPEQLRKRQIREKKRSIKEAVTVAAVTRKMEEAGLQYRIVPQYYRLKLIVETEKKTEVCFIIQYSKFKEQIELVPPAVERINQIIEEFGQPIWVKPHK